MEKTIEIDGQKVKFESKGSTPLRYKKQFGNDFFVDLMKLEGLTKIKNKKQPSYNDLKMLDMEVFYNICWVLAKTGDAQIGEPLDWLDTFEVFPLMEILPQLQDLMTNSFQTTKKK